MTRQNHFHTIQGVVGAQRRGVREEAEGRRPGDSTPWARCPAAPRRPRGVRRGVPPAQPGRDRVLRHRGEVWCGRARKDACHAQAAARTGVRLPQPRRLDSSAPAKGHVLADAAHKLLPTAKNPGFAGAKPLVHAFSYRRSAPKLVKVNTNLGRKTPDWTAPGGDICLNPLVCTPIHHEKFGGNIADNGRMCHLCVDAGGWRGYRICGTN